MGRCWGERVLAVLVLLPSLAAAAVPDPSRHGPYAVGFTRRT
jgi:hypothetical protein